MPHGKKPVVVLMETKKNSETDICERGACINETKGNVFFCNTIVLKGSYILLSV